MSAETLLIIEDDRPLRERLARAMEATASAARALGRATGKITP
jgi:ActR/RegA family two-component response regulator